MVAGHDVVDSDGDIFIGPEFSLNMSNQPLSGGSTSLLEYSIATFCFLDDDADSSSAWPVH